MSRQDISEIASWVFIGIILLAAVATSALLVTSIR